MKKDTLLLLGLGALAFVLYNNKAQAGAIRTGHGALPNNYAIGANGQPVTFNQVGVNAAGQVANRLINAIGAPANAATANPDWRASFYPGYSYISGTGYYPVQ